MEGRPSTEPDFAEMVLKILSDADLELLQELEALRESGFDEEQAASMMGDRYQLAQDAVEHFRKAYQELADSLRLEKGVHGL